GTRSAADPGGGEGRLNPGADLEWVAAGASGSGPTIPSDEVVDLPVTDVFLELCQRRRRVSPVEAANGHDWIAGRELIARRVVGVDCRRHPGVTARIGLQQADQGGRRPAAVQEPAATIARISAAAARR